MAKNQKKFLDANGVTYLAKMLDNYPDNEILGTVIDSIQGELEKKANKTEIPQVTVTDVQINGTSILSNGVANVPIASSSALGAVRNGGMGLGINASGELYINKASDTIIKQGTSLYAPIVSSNQHVSVFYGLAKAAGDSTQEQSTNTVGAYTDSAKAAINTMLGSVDKISLDNAGITAKSYTLKFNGEFSVTTATTSGWKSPYKRASVTGRFKKEYNHRVTFNNVEYILPTQLWFEVDAYGELKVYEYLGNLSLFINDTTGVPEKIYDVPFIIISDYNSNNSIDVLTQTAGTYTIKIEQINNTQIPLPASLIYGDSYVPFAKKTLDGSTYNGFSIGTNELKNSRGTVAIGYGNSIEHEMSILIGDNNKVLQGAGYASSFAFGYFNWVKNGGIAIGQTCESYAAGSLATGYRTRASGENSFTSGYDTRSSGLYSAAFGLSTEAEDGGIFVLGAYNNNDNNNKFNNWTSGQSYAVGDIIQYNWRTENVDTEPAIWQGFVCKTANSDTTFNSSKWQSLPQTSDAIFIIGNGTSSTATSNALKIDRFGNGFFNGDIYINCNANSSGGTKLISTSDYASTITAGIIQVGNGFYIDPNSPHILHVNLASLDQIKRAESNASIQASQVAQVAFYGLAKAAGDTTQSSSSNTIGTYTPEAQGAIQNMLGISNLIATQENNLIASKAYAVGDIFTANGKLYKATSALAQDAAIILPSNSGANCKQTTIDEEFVKHTDIATASVPGLVRISGYGLVMKGDVVTVITPTLDLIKAGTNEYRAITASNQHASVFYGLAKAAGDTTQAASSNAVGTYTTAALAAIHTMLDIPEGAPLVESVSGTSVTITGQPNTRYMCGEVTSIEIIPPAAGSVDVVFTSGSSVALLTLPSTVKMPEWFDTTTLETNTIYEILITDGIYGSVMSWPT